MIVEATPPQVRSILGAMCRVAAPLSPADRAAIEAAYRYVFRGSGPLDIDGLTPTSPEALAQALPDTSLAQSAVRFLAVMALVDGRIDEGKIARVAGSPGISGAWPRSPWPTSERATPSRRSIPPPTRPWRCSERAARRPDRLPRAATDRG